MTNFKTRLLTQLASKKVRKSKGFTLVELMVVIVIVGILTAVGLPELTKSQNKAKSAAAKSLVVNASKDCATSLLFGDTPDALPTGVTGACEASAGTAVGSIAAADGGETWTIIFDENGIPGLPGKS